MSVFLLLLLQLFFSISSSRRNLQVVSFSLKSPHRRLITKSCFSSFTAAIHLQLLLKVLRTNEGFFVLIFFLEPDYSHLVHDFIVVRLLAQQQEQKCLSLPWGAHSRSEATDGFRFAVQRLFDRDFFSSSPVFRRRWFRCLCRSCHHRRRLPSHEPKNLLLPSRVSFLCQSSLLDWNQEELIAEAGFKDFLSRKCRLSHIFQTF